jgi:hypothetical protein
MTPARLAAAVIALVAFGSIIGQSLVVVIHPAMLGGSPGIALWRLFGFFTILTNLAVAVSMAVLALRGRLGRPSSEASLLGCLTLSMVQVGIVYHLLLSDLWDPQGLHWWADQGLHTVVPMLLLAYWGLFAAKVGLDIRQIVRWMAYPIAYFGVMLARGGLEGWYPYPFFDVRVLGYAQVLMNAAALLLGFIATGIVLMAISRRVAVSSRAA